MADTLSDETQPCLDTLLDTDNETFSPVHDLKKPPGNPAPAAFIKLTETLDQIKATGILSVDMSGLNNNFQRSLARYARQYSTYRMNRLKEDRRDTVRVCLLCPLYQNTCDAAVQMHDKLMNKMDNKADQEMDDSMKVRRKHSRSSRSHDREMLGVLLDEDSEQEPVRSTVFTTINAETLKAEMDAMEDRLGNQYSDSFKRVIARHSCMRQCAPALIKHSTCQVDTQHETASHLMAAVDLLTRMHEEGQHKRPENAPTGFMPNKLQPFVFQDDKPLKSAWEGALLTVLRDPIKSGNLSAPNRKRFASLDTFLISETEGASRRAAFLTRASLPANPDEVPAYRMDRLNRA